MSPSPVRPRRRRKNKKKKNKKKKQKQKPMTDVIRAPSDKERRLPPWFPAVVAGGIVLLALVVVVVVLGYTELTRIQGLLCDARLVRSCPVDLTRASATHFYPVYIGCPGRCRAPLAFTVTTCGASGRENHWLSVKGLSPGRNDPFDSSFHATCVPPADGGPVAYGGLYKTPEGGGYVLYVRGGDEYLVETDVTVHPDGPTTAAGLFKVWEEGTDGPASDGGALLLASCLDLGRPGIITNIDCGPG